LEAAVPLVRLVAVPIVVALAIAAPASADAPRSGAAVVTPASGHVAAEWHKTLLEMPAAVNPLWGTGENPCVRFGPRGKLLSAISFGEVSCTAELGTVLTTGWSHFCSSFEVGTEFFAVGRQEQRACARAVSTETGVSVTVDGHTVDIFTPQFTSFSPQTTVQLPADNVFGVPGQTATVTAYGWRANVRNLSIGRHLITITVAVDGETFAFHHVIDITPVD
jgi:hypothetical protein